MSDASDTSTIPEPDSTAACARCGKPASLCVCDTITPIDNRVAVLILQHPQEQDKTLGTARLTAAHLTDAVFKVGLSWPSLARALGRPADPRRWATLYMGAAPTDAAGRAREITALDGKGAPLPDAALAGIEGIILLDGTWSQAKTLWWRNPWLLKGRRVVLNPAQPSRYGALRREPRREGLSTLEAAALLLSRVEARPEIEAALLASFDRMLAQYRAARPAAPGRGASGQRPHANHRRPRPGRSKQGPRPAQA